MEWMYLIGGGIAEIIWALGLKESHGFTEWGWSAITVLFLTISFYLFAKALRLVPIGTAYAVFTGIGSAGSAIVGILFLNESVSFLKIAALVLLVVGILGLKLIDGKKDGEA